MYKDISVFKDYAISSAITFATAFIVALGAQLSNGALTGQEITFSLVAGIGWVALRAGVKAVIEFLVGIGGAYTVKKDL